MRATGTYRISVRTARGRKVDAERILNDIIVQLNEMDWVYASVGLITVEAHEIDE